MFATLPLTELYIFYCYFDTRRIGSDLEGHDLGLIETQCWHFLGGNEENGERSQDTRLRGRDANQRPS